MHHKGTLDSSFFCLGLFKHDVAFTHVTAQSVLRDVAGTMEQEMVRVVVPWGAPPGASIRLALPNGAEAVMKVTHCPFFRWNSV
jgi:hypothetical protein